jgi:hypothetical protein
MLMLPKQLWAIYPSGSMDNSQQSVVILRWMEGPHYQLIHMPKWPAILHHGKIWLQACRPRVLRESKQI